MANDYILPGLERALKDTKNKKETNEDRLQILKGKPFWIWDKQLHKKIWDDTDRMCCFNHITGLPIKGNRKRPLYDYQQDLYELTMRKCGDARLTDEQLVEKYGTDYIRRLGIWIEKATGLGISEFYLRFMAWLACYDDYYKGSDFCIVTGPNVELATDLIERLKDFFVEQLNIHFDESKFEVNLNGVHIQAYPSHNLASMRGLPNVKFILLDEADFFPLGEQKKARAVSERYIGKSSAVVVMVSTPNPDEPEGLYAEMKTQFEELEKRNMLHTSIYDKRELPWTVGKGTIFSEAEINAAKLSPSFETEYNLQRGFGLGNLFLPETITKMLELGDKYGDNDVDVNHTYVGPLDTFELVFDLNAMFTRKDVKFDKPLLVPTIGSTRIMGVDGAFGSSKFAIVVVELIPGEAMIKVLYADEFERIDYQTALDKCDNLIKFYNIKRVYIDGANPEVVGGIRKLFAEVHDWTLDRRPDRIWSGYPVSFSKEGRPLLAKLQRIGTMGNLAIHRRFNDLIIQLRIAQHQSYNLEKVGKTQLDMLDALRLATKHFAFT